METQFIESALWRDRGLAIVRIITGFFLAFHGWELFSAEKMQGYMDWAMFKNSSMGSVMAYGGKLAELIAGILLFIGLFTRFAALLTILTMGYIAFFIGNGKVWYEDQHPFMYVLLGMVFLFCGPGGWSLDRIISNKKTVHVR